MQSVKANVFQMQRVKANIFWMKCATAKRVRSGFVGAFAIWTLRGSYGCCMSRCDTGTSGRRLSDGNIVLVRFLDSHEGDGVRAIFAGVHLLYKITPHMIILLKSPTVKGFTANNLRGSVQYWNRPPARAWLTWRSAVADRSDRDGLGGLPDGSLVSLQ